MRPQIRLKRRMHKAPRTLPSPTVPLPPIGRRECARGRIYMIYLSSVRSTVRVRERDRKEKREWNEKSGAEAELGWRTTTVYAVYTDGTMITGEETDSLSISERRK